MVGFHPIYWDTLCTGANHSVNTGLENGIDLGVFYYPFLTPFLSLQSMEIICLSCARIYMTRSTGDGRHTQPHIIFLDSDTNGIPTTLVLQGHEITTLRELAAR